MGCFGSLNLFPCFFLFISSIFILNHHLKRLNQYVWLKKKYYQGFILNCIVVIISIKKRVLLRFDLRGRNV